jgi:hypothetical protein
MELARYLDHDQRYVRAYARRLGLLRFASGRSGFNGAFYLTPEGAQRVMAHIRAVQGKEYLRGKDYHAEKERHMQSVNAWRAKKKAEQAALLARSQFAIAFPRAGTEDESREERAGRVDIAETAVVSSKTVTSW